MDCPRKLCRLCVSNPWPVPTFVSCVQAMNITQQFRQLGIPLITFLRAVINFPHYVLQTY